MFCSISKLWNKLWIVKIEYEKNEEFRHRRVPFGPEMNTGESGLRRHDRWTWVITLQIGSIRKELFLNLYGKRMWNKEIQ